MSDMEAVLTRFEEQKDQYLRDLSALAAIPSVSFDGFDPGTLNESARATAELLTRSGFTSAEVIDFPGAHPFVLAERRVSDSAPTLLCYAHHDVQPGGEASEWTSPPFEPTERQDRLYGRGTGDDKAGIIAQAAAVDAWSAAGGPPVNLVCVVEGEEEIGSVNLEPFLKEYAKKLRADALLIVDTANPDTGLPSLTNSLRGMVALTVEVKALRGPVHSGLWGGPIPDPAVALAKMIAGLVDDEGRITLPGLYDSVRPLSAAEKASLEAFPIDAAGFREQSGMRDGVELLGGVNPFEFTWRQPSLNVNAIQASSRKDARNIVVDSAWAKIGIRLVPDQDPGKVQETLIDALERSCPWGLELVVEPEQAVDPWHSSTDHPIFAAATRALEQGYGRSPVVMGCGGSIPVVDPLCRVMGGGPALLVGIEDPYTNAHGIDESVSLADLWGTTRSLIHLFAECAEVLRQ